MGTLAGWILQLVNGQFRRDQSGRVVFLPYGPRKAGYYIDASADHKKIESLVAIYTASTGLFQVLGFLSSYLLAQAVIFPDRPVTRSGKMEVALIVYFISTLLSCLLVWSPLVALEALSRHDPRHLFLTPASEPCIDLGARSDTKCMAASNAHRLCRSYDNPRRRSAGSDLHLSAQIVETASFAIHALEAIVGRA